MTGADGSRVRDGYRLITTLTDHRRFPAAALVRLYHERWEIESAYFALRHTLLDGHVLRSGDRPGLEQETWALLTLYQLLRMAMVDRHRDPARAPTRTGPASPPPWKPPATSSPPPPAICPDGPADLPGAIGRAVLATLLPARRPRYSARNVKCATSRYHDRDDGRPAHPAAITAIDIAICTPPVDLKPGRTRPRPQHTPPAPPAQPPTRRQRITAIITSQPPATGAATNSPCSWTSNPATCSPSSANGHASASSPAPASAPTDSTRRQPNILDNPPDLNYAALLRGRCVPH